MKQMKQKSKNIIPKKKYSQVVHQRSKTRRKTTKEPNSYFLKKITDKIIKHYNTLNDQRDFDKQDEKKERIIRKQVKEILDAAISSHTAERAIEDGQPFIDFAFVHNKLSTVSFDLTTSAMSRIMIFIVDRNQIKMIQEIEKDGLIILSLEFNEDASYMFTGGFKSGVGLWKYNGKKMEFEFEKQLGFADYQIRSVFWSEVNQVLFVKRRFEDKNYDEIFGYFSRKTDGEFEQVELQTKFKTDETMMDNDSFSTNENYFFMSLPNLKDTEFNYRPFFSTLKPRRREKTGVLFKFDYQTKSLKPMFKLATLSGKIAFNEDSTHMVYLKEKGPIKIIKLSDFEDSYKEIGEKNLKEKITEIEYLDESTSFNFSGITQLEIDSFEINSRFDLLAVTERNKIVVYELGNEWDCHLLMEYNDTIVLSPPILLSKFSSDGNFILCRGHSKIIIVDIYGEEKMQQLSTLKGIDEDKNKVKAFVKKKLTKKNSLDKIIDEKNPKKISTEEDNGGLNALKSELGAGTMKGGGFEIVKSKIFDESEGVKFLPKNPIFYFSKDETCVLAIDESMENLLNGMNHLEICRWTGINKTGMDQSKVKTKIYTVKIPENFIFKVVAVNDSNCSIILSLALKEQMMKKVTVTRIMVLNLNESEEEFEESVLLNNEGQVFDIKYFKAQFLNNRRDLLTLDVEFNPKIWEFDQKKNIYNNYNIFENKKLNYNLAVLSDDNTLLTTEYKKTVSIWTVLEEKKFTKFQSIGLPENTGKVRKIFCSPDKSLILIYLEPMRKDSNISFRSLFNPNSYIKVYLEDKKNKKYCLIQTEKISENFQIKIDQRFQYILLEFGNMTEVWKIKERSICYESTLPKLEYDQISPSFNRTLHRVKDKVNFLYFQLQDLRSGFLQLQKNMKNLYMLKELFNTKTGVINPKAIKMFLESYCESIDNTADKFKILHSKVNLLLITTFTSNPELLKTVLNEIDYIPFFYQEGYDPIDSALVMGHIESLNELANFFKIKSDGRTNPIISYLNIRRVANCMKTFNLSFRKFVIEYFLEEAQISDNEISPVDSFPLDECGFEIIECWTRFLDKKLAKKISKKSEKNFLRKMDPVRVKCLTTSFAINTNLIFNSNTFLLEAIEDLPNELLVGNIRHILRYLWRKNWFTVACFTFVNWVNYGLFILYILFFTEHSFLGIINLTISTILLFFEILAATADWARWKRDASNFYDIIQFTGMPTLTILNMVGVRDYSPPLLNFIVNMIILIAGYRSLLKLKIFGKVRYMIDMIRQVFSDMVGFSVIFGFSILYFAFIGINSVRKPEGAFAHDSDKFDDFLGVLNSYYNVAFGDFSILVKDNWAQVIHYLITTVFLALVMFNLMAATIWETFGNFQKKKVLVDLRSISMILVDYTHLFSYLNTMKCVKKRDKKGLKFLCLIVPEEDNVELVEELRELKKSTEDSNSDLMTICSQINQNMRTLGNDVAGVKSDFSRIQGVENNVKEVEGIVSEVIRSVNSVKEIVMKIQMEREEEKARILALAQKKTEEQKKQGEKQTAVKQNPSGNQPTEKKG